MNILMATNTYLPHVGGVAKSVAQFTEQFRSRGHRVLVLAPEFENSPLPEHDVVRIPAIQNFNGSDFSVRLPIPSFLFPQLNEFRPDIVHSHHPFLLGDTALRIASMQQVPLVFTYHTMYERYTHYVPGDSEQLKRFVIELSKGYANLCNRVIVPSESIRDLLQNRGVETKMEVIPTGVDTKHFAAGNGQDFRKRHGIPTDAFVVGHVGRLAPEKNLIFLTHVLCDLLTNLKRGWILIVGEGPTRCEMETLFAHAGLSKRVIFTGVLTGDDLVSSYQAMDVFSFSSLTETQGMVLVEAMACGKPVVALDAPGVREVVRTGENGFLLLGQSRERFSKTLQWLAACPENERNKFSERALATADELSLSNTATKALRLYQSLLREKPVESDIEESPWSMALRGVESEWSLLSSRTRAARYAIFSRRMLSSGLFRAFGKLRKQLRKLFFTRNELIAFMLGLDKSYNTGSSPGLVLIQIDGLSRIQLEAAIERGKLPFLRRLIRRFHYQPYSLYSGLPSSTPAVQGELFYGEKQAVPAFGFYHRERKEEFRMLEPESALIIEKQLSEHGQGLLSGGSSYSNIYTGGAKEANYCCASFGWGRLVEADNPWSLPLAALLHIGGILRCLVLIPIEIVLAIMDCLGGIFSGKDLVRELLFIPTRVAICILLREMVSAGAILDAVRGLPIIHLNLLGYDEQAHRRGPRSQFAQWTLKGIDRTIWRIWSAARKSSRRDYEVWIYSDHGQEETTSYRDKYGRTVEEAVRKALGEGIDTPTASDRYQGSSEFSRAEWIGGKWPQRLLRKPSIVELENERNPVRISAVGPLGHVYFEKQLEDETKQTFANKLAVEAHIPLVLYRAGNLVWAITTNGQFELPREGCVVLGINHPFLEETIRDLIALVDHPLAGDFVISGWSPNEKPISFPLESGAHGGPGATETHGFLLLPKGAAPSIRKQHYLRPSDLRDAALQHLHRKPDVSPTRRPTFSPTRPRGTLRVMTYNVHSCIGLDKRMSARRIARVIAQFEPDIIALQELDFGRSRTLHLDQAHEIARELEMDYHFHPAFQIEEERYGDAILSRFPIRVVKSDALPRLSSRRNLEPRGAIWVAVEVDGFEIQCFNTHLGLFGAERKLQAEALLGPDWLGHPQCRNPVILFGDFNTRPNSEIYRMFCQKLVDTQANPAFGPAQATWHGQFPVARIDYIFVSQGFKIVSSIRSRLGLARMASDHFPVVVDLQISHQLNSEIKPLSPDQTLKSRVIS